MYTYETKDCGILYTALSNYIAELEKCLKIDGLPLVTVQQFTRTIERTQQILEEL